MYSVSLNVYDLSGGMAAQFSRQLVGKQIDGIWHTGLVVYNKEFYYGGGISYDSPGSTPFGKSNIVNQICYQVSQRRLLIWVVQKCLKRCSWSC